MTDKKENEQTDKGSWAAAWPAFTVGYVCKKHCFSLPCMSEHKVCIIASGECFIILYRYLGESLKFDILLYICCTIVLTCFTTVLVLILTGCWYYESKCWQSIGKRSEDIWTWW